MNPISEANNLNIKGKLELFKSIPSLQREYEAAIESPYYWWWQCLKESSDYEKALRGMSDEPVASMARDFGELEDNFVLWWIVRGRDLLAGQVVTPMVRKLEPTEVAHDQAIPSLYIKVPLSLSRKDLNKQLTELLDRKLAKARQQAEVNAKPVRQLYPDQRIRAASIKVMLDVWRARKHTTDEWWQTGERLKLSDEFICQPSDDPETVKRKQRMMSLTTQRLYRSAAAMIDFAAQGDFPRVK